MSVGKEVDLIRIIVMDDEYCIRDTVRMMLQESGFIVDCAKDGDETIQLYTKAIADGKPYDLVLLDLIIKESYSGYEALTLLKKIDPKVKAILVSGCHDSPLMISPVKYGFCARLRKPYSADELRETVAKYTVQPTT